MNVIPASAISTWHHAQDAIQKALVRLQNAPKVQCRFGASGGVAISEELNFVADILEREAKALRRCTQEYRLNG